MLYETEELPKTHDEYVKTSSSRRIEQQETVIIWFLSIVSQFPETADHDTGNHSQPGSKCSQRTHSHLSVSQFPETADHDTGNLLRVVSGLHRDSGLRYGLGFSSMHCTS